MTGMTGNELARQIVKRGDDVIGFDNFFASSTETIKDVIDSEHLEFFEGDINNDAQMKELEEKVTARKAGDLHQLCSSRTYRTFLSC